MTGMSSDRRSHSRRHLAVNGSNPLIATLGVLPRAAVVCDLSPGGLGLLSTFSPPVGAILPVWLPGRPGQPSSLILAIVIHVQAPGSEGLYRIGVSCHDDSGRTALSELIARLGDDPSAATFTASPGSR